MVFAEGGKGLVAAPLDAGDGVWKGYSRDWLIVAGLSRIARSVGQIAILVDGVVNDGIKVITTKKGMEIKGYLVKGANLANVARIYDVSWTYHEILRVE